MRVRTLLKSMTIALAAVGASIPTQAQTAWTMASGYPETSFFTQNARQFIKEIEDKSGGKLKIDRDAALAAFAVPHAEP